MPNVVKSCPAQSEHTYTGGKISEKYQPALEISPSPLLQVIAWDE